MRVLGTIHNRRGDPLLLLRLLRLLMLKENVRSIGVSWSVPSGNAEPSWEELVQEEGRIQEKMRSCVRRVHESGLSWEARSFLGRCYRSFQYEFMVALNLKRHDRDVRLILLDDPAIRDIRYSEIGNPRALLEELQAHPFERQAEALRARYNEYRAAYDNMEVYAEMILRPKSVLLETSLDITQHMNSRQEHVIKTIQQFKPDIVILRLYQCLPSGSEKLRKAGFYGSWDDFLGKVVPSRSVMRLSQAETMVGPMPSRD